MEIAYREFIESNRIETNQRKPMIYHIVGLMQERRNSIALELRLSYTSPSMCVYIYDQNWYNKIDDFVKDCSNLTANTMELLQSCTKP